MTIETEARTAAAMMHVRITVFISAVPSCRIFIVVRRVGPPLAVHRAARPVAPEVERVPPQTFFQIVRRARGIPADRQTDSGRPARVSLTLRIYRPNHRTTRES